MAGQSNSEGGWPGGWLIAVVAGVIAAILARWIGDVGMAAAVLVGIFVFLVFGVLLGMFWATPATGGDHGHGAHGHGDHDHAGHDHAGHDHAGHDLAGHDHAGHDHAAQPHAAPVAEPVAKVEPAAKPEPVAKAEPVAEVAAPAPVIAQAAPVKSAPVAEVADGTGTKPAGLAGPRGGTGDALQTIEGIGPVLEKLCHELGIYHFDQIAGWGAPEVAWMDGNLKGFKGRVSRDKWVRQAKLIGEVGIEEFKRRAKTNDY